MIDVVRIVGVTLVVCAALAYTNKGARLERKSADEINRQLEDHHRDMTILRRFVK